MKKILLVFALSISVLASAQEIAWIKTYGGAGYDSPKKVITDEAGNVYMIGNFEGTSDFDPGAGNFEITSNGLEDMYILKLDATGNFLWAKSIGNEFNDTEINFEVDATGNIYIVSGFNGTIDLDPNNASFLATSNGIQDAFLLKLGSDGNFIWAKTWGSIGIDYALSITIRTNGNIIVGGIFSEIVDFDPTANTLNITSQGDTDNSISEFNNNGEFINAFAFGGSDNEFIVDQKEDLDGNLYFAGFFNGVSDFDPSANISNLTSQGQRDLFFLKLDSNFNFVWAKKIGGDFSSETIKKIAVDNENNLLIGGGFSRAIDFDPNEGEAFEDTVLEYVFGYILKLDENGNFIWVYTYGDEFISETWSIAIDLDNNVIATGKFFGEVDMNPDPDEEFFLTSTANEKDFFLLKLSENKELLAAYSGGGPARDVGTSVHVNNQNEIFLTATFRETADVELGSGITNITSQGDTDVLITKVLNASLNVSSFDEQVEIYLYPNPTQGKIIFSVVQQYDTVCIEITNMLGQKIHQKTFHQNEILEMEINSESGIYFCTIVLDGNQTDTIKIIKE